MSRRTFLAAAAAASGIVVAGCSGQTAEGPLRYWHLMSGGDGGLMADLVARIRDENPDLAADQTVLSWGAPYYTKLAMATVGDKAPDLAVMHHSRAPGYAPGGLLDPWDLDLLAELGVTEDKFPPRVWQKGIFDGQVYSIALDTHPFIMMYNTELTERAGLLGGNGQIAEITSPDQLLEAGRKLAEITGGHGISYGYLGDGAQMWRFFYTLYRQLGADFILTPGRPAEVDLDAAVTALDLMCSILDGEIATASGDGGTAIAEFASGSSGLLFTGVWETPTMKDAGIGFDAATIPIMFGTPAAYADSHAFVLPHQSEPGPARERAHRFLATLLKISVDWAAAGHIPAFLPVAESQEYRDLVPQSHYADAAEIINYDPEAWFTGSGSNFQNYFAENIQNVLLGRVDPRVGMSGFVDRIDSLLMKPNPVG